MSTWEKIKDAFGDLGIFRWRVAHTLEKDLNRIIEERLKADRQVVKVAFFRGSVDCPGISFGGAIYDLHNPPWARTPDSTIVGIPHATFMDDVSWDHIFSQKVF